MQKDYTTTAKRIFSFVIVLAIVSACQKDRKNDCKPTMASVSGTYRLTALKYKASPSSAEQDYLLYREDCENDDYVILKTDGTYQYQDAGTTCSPAGDDNGTWTISGNTIISDGIVAGTIENFDCRSLTVYTSGFIIPGDKITLTITRQ